MHLLAQEAAKLQEVKYEILQARGTVLKPFAILHVFSLVSNLEKHINHCQNMTTLYMIDTSTSFLERTL